jgi:hypothetical protein
MAIADETNEHPSGQRLEFWNNNFEVLFRLLAFRLFGTIDLRPFHIFFRMGMKQIPKFKILKIHRNQNKCFLTALHDFFQSVFEVRSLSGMD